MSIAKDLTVFFGGGSGGSGGNQRSIALPAFRPFPFVLLSYTNQCPKRECKGNLTVIRR
jgi:hypothetical protein